MVQYDNYRMALKRLEGQYENHNELDEALPRLLREAVAESVIQRFETCCDCLWKALERCLVEELGIADSPNSPKPVFRLAFESDLIPAPVERWPDYAEGRVDTARACSGEKVRAALEVVGDFIADSEVSLHRSALTRAHRSESARLEVIEKLLLTRKNFYIFSRISPPPSFRLSPE